MGCFIICLSWATFVTIAFVTDCGKVEGACLGLTDDVKLYYFNANVVFHILLMFGIYFQIPQVNQEREISGDIPMETMEVQE